MLIILCRHKVTSLSLAPHQKKRILSSQFQINTMQKINFYKYNESITIQIFGSSPLPLEPTAPQLNT